MLIRISIYDRTGKEDYYRIKVDGSKEYQYGVLTGIKQCAKLLEARNNKCIAVVADYKVFKVEKEN